MKYHLISVSADAKTIKGEKKGYLTAIVRLSPSDKSGVVNVCPFASDGCRAACLDTAGMGGVYKSIQLAREKKTLLFASDRKGFLELLALDIANLIEDSFRRGLIPCVRPNGTSDLPYELFGIMALFPHVQFYDYTKNPHRMEKYLAGGMPSNYHLTFSRSESNQADVERFLGRGNVAVVFAGKVLPETWNGVRVINGDESDLRFLDDKGVVVGLTAKGQARGAQSGFVVDLAPKEEKPGCEPMSLHSAGRDLLSKRIAKETFKAQSRVNRIASRN